MRVNVIAVSAFLLAAVACQRSDSPEATKVLPSSATSPAASVAAVEPAVPPPAPPPPAAPLIIPAGQALRVRTASALSTKSARNGEAFTAVLVAPLVLDGVTVAPAGSSVAGVVAHSTPGGRVKGVASIGVRLTALTLAGGKQVPLSTGSYVKAAPHTKKKDALKIGIGSGVGAAIGALAGGSSGAAIGAGAGAGAGTGAVLATRGDAAVIPAESVLTFKLQRAVTVER